MAAAAYRAAAKIEDLRTAQVFDFRRKGGVVSAEIVAPIDAGEFARDRAALWNAAEAAEKRKDSRTAREWIVALPSELDAEQRAAVARAFAQELVDRYGVAADIAIHAPSRGGDDRNHHAHILCTTRVIAGDALGEKSELELSDAKRKTLGFVPAADEISKLRERWAALANAALEKAGIADRIDHRSLADQQAAALAAGDLVAAARLTRQPQTHVGVAATSRDRNAGHPTSERGRARAEAQRQAAAAAAYAPLAAAAAVKKHLPAAAEIVAAAAVKEQELRRADIGPARAVRGPTIPQPRADIGPTRAVSGPHEEKKMDGNLSAGLWPGSMGDLKAELARLGRPIGNRFDEALPDRVRLAELRAAEERRRAEEEKRAAARKKKIGELAEWDRLHPWRRRLAKLGLPAAQRVALVARIDQLSPRPATPADVALAREIAALAPRVAQLEATSRPRLEAAIAADQARAAPLRTCLDQWERYERGQVGRHMSPGYSLQAAYDQAADRPHTGRRLQGQQCGPVDWVRVAIRGTAAAIAAGYSVVDVQAELARCWPGDMELVPGLIQQGRAQHLVDVVRERIETGAEPITEQGQALVALIAGADDAAARAAIAPDVEGARRALVSDPGLRQQADQEKDRPAPRLA